MAIDTAAKRFSMMNLGTPYITVFPEPDGTFDAGNRLHLLNLYGGVLAGVTTGDIQASQIFEGGMVVGQLFSGGMAAGQIFEGASAAGQVED
jgi:hypothetical protein